ncbi:tail fiber protein [Acinetobacter johnsonii]|uniref:tail fiber protein n=1 Tax=Acinetobacter johnsonii TaxID=40214 RepID=UPI003D169A15
MIDNLTTHDATKVASARTVKELQDKKLEASDLKDASTTQKGVVQLNDTLTSTSTIQALTAEQGKALNDKMFGVSQSSKPATIISGTTYTNTKNKPITISVSMSGSSNSTASITIKTHVLFSTNSSNLYIGSFTVGPGEDYKVTGNNISAIEFS